MRRRLAAPRLPARLRMRRNWGRETGAVMTRAALNFRSRHTLRQSTAHDGRSVVKNVVIATELTVLTERPLLAMLILHTMEGAQVFAINGDVAEGLIEMLKEFVCPERS